MTRLRATLTAAALALLIGQITDATTGQPLTHVTVELSGAHPRVTTTDTSGAYRFLSVAPGRYQLTIHSRDVPPVSRRVTVHRAKTTLNITACSTTLDYSCAAGAPGPG